MKSKYKDRISHLPEPIRSKVISFLPMRDAIRTAVLSKEWRCTTSSLPNLEFDQRLFESKKTFRNVVDRLLLSRQRVDVERFALSVNGGDNLVPHHVKAWILFALHNNVRVFHLNVWSSKKSFDLPSCFFQHCSTLTDLGLAGIALCLKVPLDAVFLSLKRCTLKCIKFSDDTFTRRLSFSCPLIRKLTIKHCFINICQKTFTISSPTLKILTLYANCASTEIMINASNLQKIRCIQTPLPTMSYETLCSLLTTSFASDNLTKIRDCGVKSILFGLRNVVRLRLCELYIEYMARHPNLMECMSSCSGLRLLDLKIYTVWSHVNVIVTLLKIYNNLVTLRVSFKNKPNSTNSPEEQQIKLDKFMLKNLNTVELENFGGGKEEIHIVRYILENANVLEKIKVKYLDAQKSNAITRMMVSEAFLSYRKASTCATILFE